MCLDARDENGKELNFHLFGQLGGDYRYIELNINPKSDSRVMSKAVKK
jgi:hypothetical protein